MDGIAEFYDEGQLLRKGKYLNGLKHGSWLGMKINSLLMNCYTITVVYRIIINFAQ